MSHHAKRREILKKTERVAGNLLQLMASNDEKKLRLVKQLAHFLVDNVAAKSIALQIDSSLPEDMPRAKLGKEWAQLYEASGLRGCVPYEEALAHLKDLFNL